VDRIVATRTLFAESLTIHATGADEPVFVAALPASHLQVQHLKVAQGSHVNSGDTLSRWWKPP